MRYYKFLVKTADGKVAVAAEFDAPPGKENADMAAGVIQLDKASMNNMAVKLAEGEMDNVFSRDDEAEDIFLFLAESNYLPAVYNLAVYYQCRGRKEEAKKYFDLAEKIAADDKSAGGYKNNQQ